METANHSKQIDEATKKIQLFESEPRFNRHLAFVLITELFWGKLTLPGDSVPVQTILRYKKRLKKSIDTNSSKDMRAIDASWPRYARVNTLCNNQHRVARQLREEGWLEVMYDKLATNNQEYLEIISGLKEGQFASDLHIPNLLVFPPKTPLYDHDLVKDGSLMLQDKSSCFPVTALAPPPGSCVLDACAAPGMKTSQLAATVCGDWVAALGGQPPQGAKVIAVERSSKRFSVLNEMLSRSRANEVTTTLNSDFLDIDPDQYMEVEFIVLDPSCSGTGMVKRAGEEEDPTPDRLQKLSSLQYKLLTHALKFPSVKKVVYSTCAVSEEENEQVVKKITDENSGWTVVNVMPAWSRRGHESYEDCQKFVRADPEKDWCNGFFVAVLERHEESNIPKKVKKKKSKENLNEDICEKEENLKSKIKKSKVCEKEPDEEDIVPLEKSKKNKKSKSKDNSQENVDEEGNQIQIEEQVNNKKKKKKRDREEDLNVDEAVTSDVKKKKKKKHKKDQV